jgi:hypothetical protein
MQGSTRLATTLFASALCFAQCGGSPEPGAETANVPGRPVNAAPAAAPGPPPPNVPPTVVALRGSGQPNIGRADRLVYVNFRSSEAPVRTTGKTAWRTPRPP